MKTVFIYTLSTLEEPNNIRYIGKANNLNKRLIRHLQPSYLKYKTHKNKWIKSELKKGNSIIINELDEVLKNEWIFWEQYWIAQFKLWNFHLTNGTIGGDGFKTDNKEIILKRSKTAFNKNTLRLLDDIKKFNVHQEKNNWIAERICSICKSIIIYKNKTRHGIFKSIRRAERKKSCCIECDYKNRIGSGNSFYGKSHSSKLKKNFKNVAPKKKVIMLSIENVKKRTFNSIREAAKEMNINRKGISGCCNNLINYKTAGGFKWKFK